MTTPGKGPNDYYKPGDWNAQCFECGRKFKATEMVRHWRGYYVCQAHWEPRHPQDFVRSVVDNPTPPWVQPLPPDQFAEFCTPNGQSAVPGFVQPGCVVPDYLHPAFNPDSDI